MPGFLFFIIIYKSILLLLVREIASLHVAHVMTDSIGNYSVEVGVTTQETRRKSLVNA